MRTSSLVSGLGVPPDLACETGKCLTRSVRFCWGTEERNDVGLLQFLIRSGGFGVATEERIFGVQVARMSHSE